MSRDFIRIGGAREHNLKNLTLEIPRNKLVVITGLSGSGKSSLAFDTIYAEGQRKYVESLSAYARQFLDQLKKPEVDYIEGLSPAIAIEQRTSGSNPRSIIATTTEIYDYLRLLYAHIGRPHCPETGQPISAKTTSELVDQLLALPARSRVMILAPVVRGEKGEFRDVLERLAREGFVRVRVDGEIIELSAQSRFKLDPKQKHTIEAVVDRLVIEDKIRVRLSDSVETALRWGSGVMLALHQAPEAESKVQGSKSRVEAGATGESGTSIANRNSQIWEESTLSNRLYSPATGKSYEPMTAKHFSFNSPSGACPVCHGLGQKLVFDPALVVPDPERTLDTGAVLPWRRGGKKMVPYYKAMLRSVARHYGQSMETPWRDLPEDFKRAVLYGTGETDIEFHFARAGRVTQVTRPFEGVIPNLERLNRESESEFTRNRLKAFMNPQFCDACQGRRLKPEVLAVTLGVGQASRLSPIKEDKIDGDRRDACPTPPGLSIAGVCALSVEQADDFLAGLELSEFQQKIAGELLREIRARLGFLKNVGLGYLTLDRESGTLSGGEAQRIRLATQIGAGLVGVLYILDEPSIGLHQRDNDRLLRTLEGLRDLGNTVIVVEHDADTIRHADYVLDLGPGAGVQGGELVAAGSLQDILASKASLTGRYLSGELSIPIPKQRVKPPSEPPSERGVHATSSSQLQSSLRPLEGRSPSASDRGWLEVLGARENNLQDIDVGIPLGTLTCVTGVSGSGKSTLVDDILRRALFRKLHGSKEAPGAHRELRGHEQLDKVIVIDQSPIGRTPRSNPATYTGIFNDIRDLFARLPAARVRGYDAGRFSFNVKGGRCEKCQGDGVLKLEMNFLPPVYVTCEACGGKRYNRETLEISYKGRNIADVLAITVDEATEFFRAVPSIAEACQTLAEVGLGYIGLGQAATTLSGGEAQRVKMAAELSRRQTGRTLYILDEPTTGLHFHDVAKLLEVLFKLRASGNTLLVIEHNLDVIKTADWVIDLGPEGGAGGGRIVAQGTPEQVAECEASHTGRYLRPVLGGKP